MKEFRKMAAQGDLLIIAVDEIPADAVSAKSENGKFIVAHSETGHHHVIEARPDVEYRVVPTDGLVAYLNVIRADVALEHLRPFDTHETIKIPPGKYRLRRQRQASPEGWRMVAD